MLACNFKLFDEIYIKTSFKKTQKNAMREKINGLQNRLTYKQ